MKLKWTLKKTLDVKKEEFKYIHRGGEKHDMFITDCIKTVKNEAGAVRQYQ